ncbi:voltage-gated chlorine channel protein, putative [Bodo saltans]|uniref:Chloride channel protein n=1 Tax=Bodo saltans TaxID=75058 RepID=A0A0S4IML4_BODSA|nr:voltage-gated chlorine channel protein, putative [Bodo saltans]|eukprot:CUE72834.1 voltage-gated chlorine channel protein, putative [Bodo saltans]
MGRFPTFKSFQDGVKGAWRVFADTANPSLRHEYTSPSDYQEIEAQQAAMAAEAAKFESIDYYKSYPQMYMSHLRSSDWRNVPLPSTPLTTPDHGGGGSAGQAAARESGPSTSSSEQTPDAHRLTSSSSASSPSQPRRHRTIEEIEEGSPINPCSAIASAICGSSAARDGARNAANAIVEEVTAYDASSRNSTLRWLLHVLIAVSVGLVASGITSAVSALEKWKAATLYNIVVHHTSAGSRSMGYFLGILFWSGTSLVLVAIGTAMVVWVEPAAGGSGIPDVIAYLNGVMKPKVVNLRTFITKSISCIFAVSGGLPVGMEAPLIQIGAIVGAGVTQGRSRTLGCQTKLFQAFRNNKDRRDFITAGAACGVSAAFGAPIGGLLFVMEEVSSFWDYSAAGQIFLASMISFSTVAFINSMSENQHDLGRVTNSAAVLFEVNVKIPLNLLAVVPSLFLGALCGLFAVAFTKCSLIVSRFRKRVIRPYTWRRFAEPMIIVGSFTFIMFTLAIMPGCSPTTATPTTATTAGEDIQLWHTENVSSLVNFTCHQDGYYSPLATLNLQSTKQTIRHLFNRETVSEFPAGDVFLFFLVYTVFACLSSGTFIASGLVVPLLCMGATFGRLFGLFLVSAFGSEGVAPNSYFSSESWMDPGVFALIGAGALLGGVNRMAMSICVIMVELSGELHYLLPIMVAIVISKAVADWLCEPLFHHMLHLDHVPYLPMHLHKEFEQLTAADCMRQEVLTLRERESTKNLLQAIRTTTHHAFPVLGEDYDDEVEKVENIFGYMTSSSLATDSPANRTPSRGAQQHSVSSPLLYSRPTSKDFDRRVTTPRSAGGTAQTTFSAPPSDPTRPSGDNGRRLKFIGMVTREDIQVFLSLPALQHFAVNEGRDLTSSSSTTTPPLAPPSSSSVAPPPPFETDGTFAAKNSSTTSNGNNSNGAAGAGESTSSPQYIRRLNALIQKINGMSWIDWMSHQTSLFFVTGDKKWHQNWTRANTTLQVNDASSPSPAPSRGISSSSSSVQMDATLGTTGSGLFGNTVDAPGASVLRNMYWVDESQLPPVIDLSLIVNRSPWVIPPFFNLSMAYSTFRSMGLRHMVVVDGDDVRGMITRKDLLADTLRVKLMELHMRLRETAMSDRTRRALERAREEQRAVQQQLQRRLEKGQ